MTIGIIPNNMEVISNKDVQNYIQPVSPTILGTVQVDKILA